MTTDKTTAQCKCCHGAGVQTGLDGLTVICPCCGGTGVWIATPRIDWYEMATPTKWFIDEDYWYDEM